MTQQFSHVIIQHADQTTTQGAEDRRCLQRLCQGDSEAFWEMWERHRQSLFLHYCLGWMDNHYENAEDAMSSACIKAYEHLSIHAATVTHVKSWLISLLHNHCMDIRRRQKRSMPFPESIEGVDMWGEWTAVVSPDTLERDLMRAELHRIIHHAIDNLPGRLRETARLRFVHDLTHSEIAANLNLCAPNVRKRLQHARAALKPCLLAYHIDGLEGDQRQPQPHQAGPKAMQTRREPPQTYETPIQNAAIRIVQVKTADGVERCVPLALDHVPTRQCQKIATLRGYIAKHPTGWKKRIALANLLYTTGDWEEAMATYRKVIVKQPRCLMAWLRLGDMLHGLQRDAEAIEIFENARAWARQPATQHHLQGHIARCEHNLDTAIQAFQTAATLEPNNAAHRHNLGFTYLQAARPCKALQAYGAILQKNPDDLVALTYSYRALQALGRRREAERRVKRVLEIDPQSVQASAYLMNYQAHECAW